MAEVTDRSAGPVLCGVGLASAVDGFVSTLDSLAAQDDGRWEWIVVADRPAVLAELTDPAGRAAADPRVQVLDGIAMAPTDALNRAIAAARAGHLCLLHPGDTLEQTAVRVAGGLLAEHDWLYTDEAWPFTDGGQRDWRKPGYGPELLRSQPYSVRSALLPLPMVRELGGVRAVAGSAAWYDLVLRVAERCDEPAHLAGPFYRRAAVVEPPEAPWVDGDPEDRCRVVADHCRRVGLAVDRVEPVIVGGIPLGQRVVRAAADRLVARADPDRPAVSADPERPRVSIVIPTRGATSVVWGIPRCHVVELVRQLRGATSYPDLQIVVVYDAATPPEVVVELTALGAPSGLPTPSVPPGPDLLLIPFAGPFNFSRKCNAGALAASGDYLCFLNDDVELTSPDWLAWMMALAREPGVGAVGAKLLFADGTLQHAGHRLSAGSLGHMLFRCAADSTELGGIGQVCGERSGVTAACLLMSAATFSDVGGFWEELPVNFNDIDICQKIRATGQRILYTPDAVLYHFESQSRERVVAAAEVDALMARWGERIEHDPYVNPLSIHDANPPDH